MRKILKGVFGISLLAFIGLFWVSISQAQEVVQGYNTDEQLQRGMIVGLKEDDPTKVGVVSSTELDKIHGVVVDASDAPIFIGGADGSDVYVATSGRYEVLVADSNGPIKKDDYVSVSGVDGVGQKATERQSLVLGRAAQDFVPDQGSLVLSTANNGSGLTVNVGRILVDLTVSRNPNEVQDDQSAPDFLRKAGELIAEKPVTPLRLYMSLLILTLVSAIAGSLIYASVKSSIIAIGRNPLSKKSITKSLIQVVGIAFIVLLSGLFTVYLMLRL